MAGERVTRGRLSSLDLLPEDAQDDVVWAMGELNRRDRTQADILLELNDRLQAKGFEPISKSAFNRKAVRIAAISSRIAESRALFEGIAPQFTPERIDETNIVIGELIKLVITDILDGDAGKIGPKGAMELARGYMAAIQGQKLSSARRAQVEADFKSRADKAIGAVAKEAGLSADQVAQIRRDVLGVRPAPKPDATA
ncbi:MAG: DUF3486 family protein [Rhodoblastus sp.]